VEVGYWDWDAGDREFKDLEGRELFEQIDVVMARVIWLGMSEETKISTSCPRSSKT
jgi:hypothetical protein